MQPRCAASSVSPSAETLKRSASERPIHLGAREALLSTLFSFCPEHVVVRANDRFGSEFQVEGTGLTARCFCHEIDHLDGHLFTERAERILSQEELEEMNRDQ